MGEERNRICQNGKNNTANIAYTFQGGKLARRSLRWGQQEGYRQERGPPSATNFVEESRQKGTTVVPSILTGFQLRPHCSVTPMREEVRATKIRRKKGYQTPYT